MSGLYALCGLSAQGTKGRLGFMSAFSLVFAHTLFLLPLTLGLRRLLYSPLIAALMSSSEREHNVAAMREQGLVGLLLSLLSARLIPLGDEGAEGGDGLQAAAGDGQLDVVEQVKNCLFLMWAEELQERELRAVAYFLLSDNQQVVAATSFSAAASARDVQLKELLPGWRYDTQVKAQLLELLLGVILNSAPPAARSRAQGAASPAPASSRCSTVQRRHRRSCCSVRSLCTGGAVHVAAAAVLPPRSAVSPAVVS